MIFLAVEGGLNVFAPGTGDPNPYVLLCTCLVGAVFSEDVWTKARDWLKGKRNGGQQSNDDEPEPPKKHPKNAGAAAPHTDPHAES